MIDYQSLVNNKDKLRKEFLSRKPFSYLVIDDFLDSDIAVKLAQDIPVPKASEERKDYIFTKNKFEITNMMDISKNYKLFYEEITSRKFQELMSYICNEDILIDKSLYGGGVHLGGENSYLDMHVDFNYHPTKQYWYRNINFLFYLNQNWEKNYGGSLKLKDRRTGESTEIEPLMNRMVIMLCRDYTIHGYDTVHFPKNIYRKAVAFYGYTLHQKYLERPRSTFWIVEDHYFKYILANCWNPAVWLKKKIISLIRH